MGEEADPKAQHPWMSRRKYWQPFPGVTAKTQNLLSPLSSLAASMKKDSLFSLGEP